MLVTTATVIVRITLRDALRRADAGLARGAARNAAQQVAAHQARRFLDAQTLRDLSRLDLPEPPTSGGSTLPR